NCRKNQNAFFCENRVSPSRTKDRRGYYGYRGASQFKAAKARELFKFSENISFTEMAFLEPLATVLQGIDRLRLKVEEWVLVVGAGTMGLLTAQAARLSGYRVIISDLLEKKIKTAEALGFTYVLNAASNDYLNKIREITGGRGPDSIAFTVSSSEVYRQAFEIAPKGCRFLFFASGYPCPELEINPNSVHYNLWEFIGTFGARVQDFQLASELINNRLVNLIPLVEQEFNLDHLQAAFEKASEPESYRVSLILS
ncbi:MAG: zinc-binding dehydrogenase, partial [Spirochaetota bacterium]